MSEIASNALLSRRERSIAVSTIRQIGSKSTFPPHACDKLASSPQRISVTLGRGGRRNPIAGCCAGTASGPVAAPLIAAMKLRRLMYPSGTSGHTKFGLNDTTRCRGRVGWWSWQVIVALSESRAHDSTLEFRGAYKFTGNFHESFL